MFDYELSGKQVILLLDQEFEKSLALLGIEGSPLYGKVFKAEEKGLWLDHPKFGLCPLDKPHLYDPAGEIFCHAHIFVPAQSILSVVAFPETVKELEEMPSLSRIGFNPKPPL